MALGDVTTTLANESFVVEILASATAANGAPSGASAGIDINLLRVGGELPTSIRVGIISTAGSGTMTVTLKVWMYAGTKWFVAQSLNGGSAIAETSADAIQFCESVSVIQGAARIYLEIAAIAGSSTAVTGYAIVGR